MGTPYTIRSGDTLSKIAAAHGYPDWEYLYNHPDNAAFKAGHPNANKIFPGDVLILPDTTADPAAPPAESPPPPEPSAPPEPQPQTRPPRQGTASRSTAPPAGETSPDPVTADASRTTLAARYELREIVLAQGIQFHNSQMNENVRIPGCLPPYFPDNEEHEWEHIDDSSATFVSHVQRVRFKIKVVNTKSEFKQAVQTPGLQVIYSGHARYGRGPCFGASDDPGDDWEQGADPNAAGLFRMAYKIVGVHFSEINEHGYSFYPVPASTRVRSEWRHPEIPGSLKKISLPTDLESKVLPVGRPLADKYWGFRDREGQGILLWAGWEETISDPMDLGATDLKCRCLCLFGCSTRLHWWKAVRRWKNWRRENEQFAYFTIGVAYDVTERCWFRALFEYSAENAGQSWEASLERAKRRTTQLLRSEGYRYSIY